MKKITFGLLMLLPIFTFAQEISAHEVRENWRIFLIDVIATIIVIGLILLSNSGSKAK